MIVVFKIGLVVRLGDRGVRSVQCLWK